MVRNLTLLTLCTTLSCAHSIQPLHQGDTAQLRTLQTHVANSRFNWSKDSHQLLFLSRASESDPSWTLTQIDGKSVILTSSKIKLSKKSEQVAEISNPVFIPAQDRILFEAQFEIQSSKTKSKKKPEIAREGRSVDAGHQLFSVNENGTDVLPLEPAAPSAYNAEPSACADGSIVFTSDRDGDLDLYMGQLDKWGVLTEVRRITEALGYDGEPQYSPRCEQITWTASRPINRPGKEEAEDYLDDLSQQWLKPSITEIWVGDRDGKNAHALTALGAQSQNPTFSPDGKSVIFSSNWEAPKQAEFGLYQIDLDGRNLKPLGLGRANAQHPRFSPDGRSLAFIADGTSSAPSESKTRSLFVSKWNETPIAAKR